MKKLSVKMKITLWYTGLIVIILSAIFTAVLLATDKVLLLGVQNKLEEEVYDFAEELKVDSNGRLRLEKLDFLKDGVRLAVYHENGQMITGLVASGLPETPFADELLQKAGKPAQLTLSAETRPIRGGVVLKNGLIETNCSLGTLVDGLRPELSGKVAARLFG